MPSRQARLDKISFLPACPRSAALRYPISPGFGFSIFSLRDWISSSREGSQAVIATVQVYIHGCVYLLLPTPGRSHMFRSFFLVFHNLLLICLFPPVSRFFSGYSHAGLPWDRRGGLTFVFLSRDISWLNAGWWNLGSADIGVYSAAFVPILLYQGSRWFSIRRHFHFWEP